MDSRTEQLKALSLLVDHESAMADLYWAYAPRFPDRTVLFRGLAMAEQTHVRWIRDFAARVQQGAMQVDPRRFRPAAFQTSMDLIREQIRLTGEPEMTLLTALSVAHDLEEALIERRYYEVVEGDQPEMLDLLRRIEVESSQHRAVLRRAWEEERGLAPAGHR